MLNRIIRKELLQYHYLATLFYPNLYRPWLRMHYSHESKFSMIGYLEKLRMLLLPRQQLFCMLEENLILQLAHSQEKRLHKTVSNAPGPINALSGSAAEPEPSFSITYITGLFRALLLIVRVHLAIYNNR